jgi:hypothetical protein
MAAVDDIQASEGRAEQVVTLGPAYPIAGPDGAAGGGNCSMFPDEFCFFCQYESDAEAVGTDCDLYGNLMNLVKHLSNLHREPAAIAVHLMDAYEKQVRHHVPDTPAWSRASILRHIIYNNANKAVFDDTVTSMLTALLARQNAALVDTTTGQVVEEHCKSFRSTVDTYMKWMDRNPKRQKTGR